MDAPIRSVARHSVSRSTGSAVTRSLSHSYKRLSNRNALAHREHGTVELLHVRVGADGRLCCVRGTLRPATITIAQLSHDIDNRVLRDRSCRIRRLERRKRLAI